MVIKLYFHRLLSVQACIRKRWLFQCKMRVCIKSNVPRNLLVIAISVSHWFVFSLQLDSLGPGICSIKKSPSSQILMETRTGRGMWKAAGRTRGMLGQAALCPVVASSHKKIQLRGLCLEWGCHSTEFPGVITWEPQLWEVICPAVEVICLSIKSCTVKISLLAKDLRRMSILQCSWAFTACWSLAGPLRSD